MRRGYLKNYVNIWILEDRDRTSTNREMLFFSFLWMKKERNGRPRKKLLKKRKKAITIVVLMGKESYRKVWEGVKLTAEDEMLSYLPRIMEK